MELSATDLLEYQRFAAELADAAAEPTLARFRQPLAIADKGGQQDFDPVTEADREAERVMRDLIRGTYPEHGIVGEEFGVEGDGGLAWVLDPIDGTRAYISGLPLWGTLIALCAKGRPLLGMVSQPYTGERYWGNGDSAEMRDGEGSRLLRTRACPKLTEATVCSTHPDMFTDGDERLRFQRVAAAARLTRYGGDCYLYCMLALGQIDLVIESGLQFYDIAALVPIVEGAGGIVTDWQGGRRFEAGGQVVAAGDRQLHASVLALLNA